MEKPISVTKTIYTVADFLDWQRQGGLNLRPHFQRGSVWTPKAKSFFIDTVLRGYSVPIIYLQNKQDRESLKLTRLVVDGQQRLRTLFSYIDPQSLTDYDESDKFAILPAHNREYAGVLFRDLPDAARDRIIETELSVHVLPTTLSDRHLLQLFARLNSTGERLNDQELRNAEFHGSFKSLAYSLSYEQVDRWQQWKIFTPRAIAQMKDVELTSELMVAVLYGMQNKSKKQIDDAYRRFDDAFEYSDHVESRLRAGFDDLNEVFRLLPYRREANMHTQSWLYPLFIAFDLAEHKSTLMGPSRDPRVAEVEKSAARLSASEIRKKAVRVQEALIAGSITDELMKALRGASSDLGSRVARLAFLIGR